MINALKYVDRLEKVGFTSEQAKETVGLWIDFMESNFVTKNDLSEFALATQMDFHKVHSKIDLQKVELLNHIADVKAELKADIAALRTELKEDIAELRLEVKSLSSNLTIRLGLMMTASIGLISSIILFAK